MEQRDVRFRLLQEMSADFRNRMAENWALRDAVRMAEAARHCYKQEPIHPGIAPSASNARPVQHMRTPDHRLWLCLSGVRIFGAGAAASGLALKP